jgi:hypothetical protein
MGGLAVSTAPAGAAPYPGTVKTFCHLSVVDSSGSQVKLAVKVGSVGNGEPEGRATVTLDRKGSGGQSTQSTAYQGGREVLEFNGRKPGKYTATLDFNSKPADSVYKNCSDSISFKVTRR